MGGLDLLQKYHSLGSSWRTSKIKYLSLDDDNHDDDYEKLINISN